MKRQLRKKVLKIQQYLTNCNYQNYLLEQMFDYLVSSTKMLQQIQILLLLLKRIS